MPVERTYHDSPAPPGWKPYRFVLDCGAEEHIIHGEMQPNDDVKLVVPDVIVPALGQPDKICTVHWVGPGADVPLVLVPEPGLTVTLAAGIAMLWLLNWRRRCTTTTEEPRT